MVNAVNAQLPVRQVFTGHVPEQAAQIMVGGTGLVFAGVSPKLHVQLYAVLQVRRGLGQTSSPCRTTNCSPPRMTSASTNPSPCATMRTCMTMVRGFSRVKFRSVMCSEPRMAMGVASPGRQSVEPAKSISKFFMPSIGTAMRCGPLKP